MRHLPVILAACAACFALAQPAESPNEESAWLKNIRQITNIEQGLDRSGEQYFSPDGKRMCFQAYPKGKTDYQIFVMNIDGTGLEMVSTGEGATTCAYFHPSGEKMIFAANHHDQRPAENIDDAAFAKIRAATQPAGVPPTQPAGHGGGRSPSYAWSYHPGMDVYEYTFKTRTLKRLTDADGYDAECSYSPDGKLIVFSSTRTGPQEIYIMDADGKNVRQITRAGGKNGGPFFMPDGKRIVYRSDRVGDGNLQIFTNNLEGADEVALTGADVLNWCPFPHPSGKWLIFTRADHRGRPNYDLYLLNVETKETHRVTSDPAFDGLPAFSPDGKQLIWCSRRTGLASPQIFIADFVGLTPDGTLVKP